MIKDKKMSKKTNRVQSDTDEDDTAPVPAAIAGGSYYTRRPFSVPKEEGKSYSFMLLGSTRSGKTTCLNYILAKHFQKEINVLMSDSLHAEIYKPLMKTVVPCPTFVPEIIKCCYKINKGTECKYPFNIILDDLVGYRYDKQMLKLLTIYRNSRIGCIITAQATSILNAAGRTNINFVLLFKLNSDEQIEIVCKKFLSSFFPRGMKMVERIIEYRRITENHHFIFLNNLTGEASVCKIDPV